jgi:hypothetical protein
MKYFIYNKKIEIYNILYYLNYYIYITALPIGQMEDDKITFSDHELIKTSTILKLANTIFSSYIMTDYTHILIMIFTLFRLNEISKKDRTNINFIIDNIDPTNKMLIDMFYVPELDKFSFLKIKTFENELYLLEMYLTNIGVIDKLADKFNSIHESIDKIQSLFSSTKLTSYLLYR